MRIAKRRTLAGMACVGLLLAGQVFAKDAPSSAPGVQLDTEVIPPGRSAAGKSGADVAAARPQPDEDAWRVGEKQPYIDDVDTVFGNCAPVPGCEICAGGTACPPCWYIENDVHVITRSRPRRADIITERLATTPVTSMLRQVGTGATTDLDTFVVTNVRAVQSTTLLGIPLAVLTSNSVEFDNAPGYQVTLGHYLGSGPDHRDRFLEFTYWGFNSWDPSRSATGLLIPQYATDVTYTRAQLQSGSTPIQINYYTGDLVSLFPLPSSLEAATATDIAVSHAFNNAMAHTIVYESTINNYELNGWFRPRARTDRLVMHNGRWRRECSPGWYLSYMAGLRMTQIHERFTFASEAPVYDVDTSGGGQSPGQLLGTYRGVEIANANNDLFGFQIGGEALWRQCRWSAGVHGKAGPYMNAAEMARRIVVAGPDGYLNILTSEDRVFASVLGEFGFLTSYQFRPNLTARASYDFVWAGGVALAPKQLAFQSNAPANINNGGTVFYHGLTLGLEYSW